jgi:3-hydroxyisobutyrate/3-hydroxypropionate dehydrogenase
MGWEMAKNVRQKIPASCTLYVNDVFTPACEKFLAEFSHLGPIKISASARELAETAEVIVSIVPAATHVRDVYLNPETGIIAARKNTERLMLECSTIDSRTARDVGAQLLRAGAGTYVDTPVSVCFQIRNCKKCGYVYERGLTSDGRVVYLVPRLAH